MGNKLDQNSLDAISRLTSEYQDCHSEIKEMEERMESLRNEMSYKLNRLKTLRMDEKELMERLVENYGPGRLDTQNLEWIKE